VVLITTKRGKAGKPSFSYSSGFNVNELRKPVYVNLRGEQFGSADQRLYPIAGTNADGNLTVGANFSTEKVPVTRYDYQDQIFDTGYGTDQHLSVRGGNEQSNYYASLSYTLNEGIIRNTDFQRYGARFRFNQSVSDWASFSIGLNYNNSFSNERPDGNVFWSPINAFNITNNIWDITQRDELGNLQSVEPTRVNPLSVIEDFDITQSVNRAISDFQLKLFPLKGLTIDYILGVDAYNQEGNIFIPPYPYAPVNPTYFDDGYAARKVAGVVGRETGIRPDGRQVARLPPGSAELEEANGAAQAAFLPERLTGQDVAGTHLRVNDVAVVFAKGAGSIQTGCRSQEQAVV
jgi:hypothetical protein